MTSLPRQPGYYAVVRGDKSGLTPAVYRYGPKKTSSETQLEAWERGVGTAVTEVVWEGERVDVPSRKFPGEPSPLYQQCMSRARAKVNELQAQDPHGAGLL